MAPVSLSHNVITVKYPCGLSLSKALDAWPHISWRKCKTGREGQICDLEKRLWTAQLGYQVHWMTVRLVNASLWLMLSHIATRSHAGTVGYCGKAANHCLAEGADGEDQGKTKARKYSRGVSRFTLCHSVWSSWPPSHAKVKSLH